MMKQRSVLISTFCFVWLGLGFGSIERTQSQDSPSLPTQLSTIDRVLVLPPIVAVNGGLNANDEAYSPYAQALFSALLSDLRAQGFNVESGEITKISAGPEESVQLSELAKSKGAAWIVYSTLKFDELHLSCRISLYNAQDRGLVAADLFSTISGLGAFALLDDSASRTALKAGQALKAKNGGDAVVGYRVLLLSPDEGASVFLETGSGAPTPLGYIKDGRLELPYFPFPIGHGITLTLSEKGKHSIRVGATLESEPVEIKAPSLPLAAKLSWYLDTGTGRFLGLGIGARAYFAPDWSFMYAEDRLFAGLDFQEGSYPFIHEEIWIGLGTYLIIPENWRFRFGMQTGCGLLGSIVTAPGSMNRLFVDLALRPVDFYFEWSLDERTSLRLNISAVYSLGAHAGVIPQKWMNNGAPSLSFAWMVRK